MGTRAGIRFADEWGDSYHVYRGHDGVPENVLPDIQAAIDKAKGRWDGSEVGCLVTLFLTMHWNVDKSRLPDYELTKGFHGDESYRFNVRWQQAEGHKGMGSPPGKWVASMLGGV